MPRKNINNGIIIVDRDTDLSQIKMPVPKGVIDMAKRGLRLRESFGYGGTEVGEQTAKDLCSGRVTLDQVIHIADYFPRHAGDNIQQTAPPSPGYIAWLLWGGDPGRSWSSRIAKRIRRAS